VSRPTVRAASLCSGAMTDNRLLLVALLVLIAAALTLATVYVSRRMAAIAEGRDTRRLRRQDEYACMRHLRDFNADERAELDRLTADMEDAR